MSCLQQEDDVNVEVPFPRLKDVGISWATVMEYGAEPTRKAKQVTLALHTGSLYAKSKLFDLLTELGAKPKSEHNPNLS